MDIHEICLKNKEKILDLRPYMIDEMFTVTTAAKLPQVLNMFRVFHLRQLCVVNRKNQKYIEGIITRQDIFAYMTI